MKPHHAVPFPVLIGDLGGTNARFALVHDAASEIEALPIVHTADFADIEEAIERVVLAGASRPPRSAVLAIAGPIRSERITFTNARWVVEPRRLITRFGLEDVVLLNDFEALSLALPELAAADLLPIGGATAAADEPLGTRVALGPGTGLGAAALVHARGTWIPIASEAGHVDFGPVDARDLALWPHLERPHGRVSAETLICGHGLLNLYRAIAAADGRPAPLDDPAAVSHEGMAGSDPAAVEAVERFAIYLGRLAGDLALTFLARGGVFIGGGIAPKIAPVLRAGGFRAAFEAKEPHRALLAAIPTAIIVHPRPAFVGLTAFARAQERFGVELAGRHWRPDGRQGG